MMLRSFPFLRQILLAAVILHTASIRAQQFSVSSFKQLSNDISAFVTPVYDLNNEACALLKVVCSHDFAFSTPLGVVTRKNKDGEVWLFLPKGTAKLTLKHPQWGVLRDYQLPLRLESRLTYELVVNQPVVNIAASSIPLGPGSLTRQDSAYYPHHTPLVVTIKRETRLPLNVHAQIAVSTDGHNAMSGLRLAALRRHGFYAAAFSDFKSSPDLKSHDQPQTYETGKVNTRQRLLCAGVTHRLTDNFFVYEGFGWGKSHVAFEQTDRLWVKQDDQSYEGWSAEVGAGCLWRHLTASAGLQTITGHVWLMSLGVGWKF